MFCCSAPPSPEGDKKPDNTEVPLRQILKDGWIRISVDSLEVRVEHKYEPSTLPGDHLSFRRTVPYAELDALANSFLIAASTSYPDTQTPDNCRKLKKQRTFLLCFERAKVYRFLYQCLARFGNPGFVLKKRRFKTLLNDPPPHKLASLVRHYSQIWGETPERLPIEVTVPQYRMRTIFHDELNSVWDAAKDLRLPVLCDFFSIPQLLYFGKLPEDLEHSSWTDLPKWMKSSRWRN
jgi:hypothetical protein